MTVRRGPMRLAIRCDADVATGTGHVMRCFALAEELGRRGHEVIWIGRFSQLAWLEELICGSGQRLVDAPADEARLPALVGELDPDWIVIDSYGLDLGPIGELRPDHRVVAIVDDATPRYGADMYVSPGANPSWRTAPPGAELLGGPEYVLIRAELRRQRPAHPQRRGCLRNGSLVAVMGGSDSVGMGPLLADMALRGQLPARLDLVSSHPSLAVTLDDGETNAGHARPALLVHPPGPIAFDLAAGADLVITPAGVTSWELLCLGIPTGLILAADNQRPNYDALTAREWAVGLGSAAEIAADPLAFATRLASAWDDREGALLRAARAWEAIDGRGVERVCGRLEDLR